ncbi:unnamed protein product [Cyprideis torosa]|uniref:NAD kinase 2, mitochondrial n=1 Tax=Cyprideis torosa TaxID=163714 RepID=A0A7R8WEY3_9CRUS|nr:unnamed protein product [Cyprideis torosa]CAG0896344.1 unnamed protein product [Cyprideis torosa]
MLSFGSVVSVSRAFSVLLASYPGVFSVFSNRTMASTATSVSFPPKTALILTKLTRYEFEKRRHPDLSETELRQRLTERGSDFDMMLQRHLIHKNCEKMLQDALQRHGVETRLVYRFEYNIELVRWADMIISNGGDGTFLLAASKVTNQTKPVIGINSDPSRSEGHLCLPKMYSGRPGDAIDRIFQGDFDWMYRKRIRIAIKGEDVFDTPVELHDQQLLHPEYRFLDEHHPVEGENKEVPTLMEHKPEKDNRKLRILPVFALNDVFIGETLSARVSYLEMTIEGGDRFKQKCSGLICSTGTGSTSWTFNVSKVTHQCVESILAITREETDKAMDVTNDLVERVSHRFNNQLLISPEEPRMIYTIRDPITFGVMPSPMERMPRGFARKLQVRSRCFDACLVVDGGLSYAFNDGTEATLEILDEDALRTIVFRDAPPSVASLHHGIQLNHI